MMMTTRTLGATLRTLLPGLALALLFVAAGVIHVTSRVLVVSAGYQLSKLEASSRLLAVDNSRLKLELATLKNPARLERFARGKLGMGPPAPFSVLTPPPSGPSRLAAATPSAEP